MQRGLIDEDSNDEVPRSPHVVDIQAENEVQQSAPQAIQASQTSQPSQACHYQFMPTSSVQRQLPTTTANPDF